MVSCMHSYSAFDILANSPKIIFWGITVQISLNWCSSLKWSNKGGRCKHCFTMTQGSAGVFSFGKNARKAHTFLSVNNECYLPNIPISTCRRLHRLFSHVEKIVLGKATRAWKCDQHWFHPRFHDIGLDCWTAEFTWWFIPEIPRFITHKKVFLQKKPILGNLAKPSLLLLLFTFSPKYP